MPQTRLYETLSVADHVLHRYESVDRDHGGNNSAQQRDDQELPGLLLLGDEVEDPPPPTRAAITTGHPYPVPVPLTEMKPRTVAQGAKAPTTIPAAPPAAHITVRR